MRPVTLLTRAALAPTGFLMSLLLACGPAPTDLPSDSSATAGATAEDPAGPGAASETSAGDTTKPGGASDTAAGDTAAGDRATRGAVGAAAAETADTQPGSARTPPWEAGFDRQWFYPHPRAADDARWARIARPVGLPAPTLVGLSDWRGGAALTLESLRGQVVLLEFWATWCSDCKVAAPTLEVLAERLVDEPFRSLSVCASRGAERYAAARSAWGIGLPTALDAEGLCEAAYDVPRWPYHVLIDAEGRVAAAGLKTAHLSAAVDVLLARERARGALSAGARASER